MRDWVTTSDFRYREELPRAQKELARENMVKRAEEEKGQEGTFMVVRCLSRVLIGIHISFLIVSLMRSHFR